MLVLSFYDNLWFSAAILSEPRWAQTQLLSNASFLTAHFSPIVLASDSLWPVSIIPLLMFSALNPKLSLNIPTCSNKHFVSHACLSFAGKLRIHLTLSVSEKNKPCHIYWECSAISKQSFLLLNFFDINKICETWLGQMLLMKLTRNFRHFICQSVRCVKSEIHKNANEIIFLGQPFSETIPLTINQDKSKNPSTPQQHNYDPPLL